MFGLLYGARRSAISTEYSANYAKMTYELTIENEDKDELRRLRTEEENALRGEELMRAAKEELGAKMASQTEAP